MTASEEDLLYRISVLEIEENQGRSFDAFTWTLVIVSCLIVPAIILGWGWAP